MKKHFYLFAPVFIASLAYLISCKKEDKPITFTQQMLNESTISISDVTGSAMSHDGSGRHGDSTIRAMYRNSNAITGTIEKETVVSKITHEKVGGSKGDALVTFAMFKREAGYYTEGGDWEYVMMPNTGATAITASNINGTLPAENSAGRGKLADCASCHATASGGDFLFSN